MSYFIATIEMLIEADSKDATTTVVSERYIRDLEKHGYSQLCDIRLIKVEKPEPNNIKMIFRDEDQIHKYDQNCFCQNCKDIREQYKKLDSYMGQAYDEHV
jgi:hypothetical protein